MADATRGPCGPWPALFCSELPAGSEAVSGAVLMAATQILYYKTAQLFDMCEVTLRPCRQSCWGERGWDAWREYGYGMWGESMAGPIPYLNRGQWYNLSPCGTCGDSCSCTELQQAILPGPVIDVSEVKQDGVILTPGVDYRIDDFTKLVRLNGGVWPFCQDMTLDDDQANTWSITATIGEELPELGQYAVGELTVELLRTCLGGDCVLPRNVASVTRQGVTVDYTTVQQLLENGLLGFKWCDLFINTYNPNGLVAAPQVFAVDTPGPRRVGTWP